MDTLHSTSLILSCFLFFTNSYIYISMNSRKSPPSSMESLLYVQPLIEGDPEADVFVDQPNNSIEALKALTGQGGRLFGGVTLGQSLNAAQQTVIPNFVAHAMHCSFVSGRLIGTAVQYHVERVKTGRQFCIRLVWAVQNRRTFFLALVSFTSTKTSPDSTDSLKYGQQFPQDVPTPPAEYGVASGGKNKIPFLHHSVGICSSASSNDTPSRIHQWMRAREPIASTDTGPNTSSHLAALACMSDSYLLAAAPHTHGIYNFASPPVSEVYDSRQRLEMSSEKHQPVPRPHLGFQGGGRKGHVPVASVTSMASLDQSLYFHDPTRLRAEEWLLAEIESPWADKGRTLVRMKIWGRDGALVASCTQEGLVSIGDVSKKESRL